MEYLCSLLVLLLAGSDMAQEILKNAPHFVKTLKARGAEVKFLDFGWNPDPNVIAEPPEGDTIGTVPAVFEKADTTADRLDVTLTDKKETLELTIHYGDRQAKVVLSR